MEVSGKALWTISYGMYVVTARSGGRANGQIANTVFQVTAQPPQVAIAINKDNFTHGLIRDGGWFGFSVLADGVPMEFIGLFGFKSGRDVDKLAQVAFRDGQHCPLVTDHALSITEARVVRQVDAGSHTVFVGEVVGAEVLSEGPPLTYAGYHARKGRAPKNAPTLSARGTHGGHSSSEGRSQNLDVQRVRLHLRPGGRRPRRRVRTGHALRGSPRRLGMPVVRRAQERLPARLTIRVGSGSSRGASPPIIASPAGSSLAPGCFEPVLPCSEWCGCLHVRCLSRASSQTAQAQYAAETGRPT